jgi:glycosyltransferase involved in cell wall biosynthesis
MDKAISVLHTEWSDGWGGQEIRIINEMLAMREEDIEVSLACRNHAVINQKAKESGIHVFILPFRGNMDLKTLFLLTRIIKKHRIDIVNTHSGKDTWVGGFAAKLSGAKFIRTRHLSNRIRSSRLNFINELADYIITTGESVRMEMIEHNRIRPVSIQSIPTGVDLDIFDPTKYDRAKCRRQCNLQDDEIVIGIVAVLRQFKRHDLFVQMAKLLIEQYSNRRFRFLIAGDGPQRQNIERLISRLGISEEVILLGHVEDVPEVLMALDVFVLSSDSKEGVPQSVIQALLMNKMVVATDSGSTIDLFKDGNFQLVEVGNAEALKDGVLHCLNQNNIVVNTRKGTAKHFGKETMTKKIREVYSRLVR